MQTEFLEQRSKCLALAMLRDVLNMGVLKLALKARLSYSQFDVQPEHDTCNQAPYRRGMREFQGMHCHHGEG
jgi:hypothetical protein